MKMRMSNAERQPELKIICLKNFIDVDGKSLADVDLTIYKKIYKSKLAKCSNFDSMKLGVCSLTHKDCVGITRAKQNITKYDTSAPLGVYVPPIWEVKKGDIIGYNSMIVSRCPMYRTPKQMEEFNKEAEKILVSLTRTLRELERRKDARGV